jgi:hypothetical protein
MARRVGRRINPDCLDHEHRTVAANDRKKRIMLRFLVFDIEAELRILS